MSRATLVKLLIVQTVVLVLVAWMAAFFARDEFLLATATDSEEDIPGSVSPSAEEGAGVPTVKLSAAAQKQVGIELLVPPPARLAQGSDLAASVLDVRPLVELRGRLQAARHELQAAQAAAMASTTELRRVQGMYDDDRNASLRAVEAATAAAQTDAARERAARAALAALRDEARAGWGATVATWVDAAEHAELEALVAGRAALLRVTLPPDERLSPGTVLALRPSALATPGSTATLPREAPRVQPIGPAPAAPGDPGGPGWLCRVRAEGLAPGMRLSVTRPAGAPQAGVLVPASALVWHAGQPWVYVRESETEASATEATADAFQRRAVPAARREGAQWFLPGFEEDDPLVVRGAQVLLSEELKYQIRNENDD